MIKLGIDAKWYFEGPPSGRMVVKSLIDRLIYIHDPELELYLFVNQNHYESAVKYFPGFVHIVPVKMLTNLVSNLLVIPRIGDKMGLDVLIFQNFGTLFKTKFKSIVYIHDVLFLDYPEFYSAKELLYFKLMPFLAKRAQQIITISDKEKSRLIAHKVAANDHIDVVYHGVSSDFRELDTYSAEEISSLNKMYKLPDRFVLYVGRINIRKNLLNLVKAFSLLEDQQIKLVIVGKADHKNIDFNGLIDKLALKERIVLTGHVSDEDLCLMYARATVFCFPSFAEGFGLPPLEAMRCGVPVVVSNATCLPEICGDAALYAAPDDPSAIAQQINILLNKGHIHQAMTVKGKAHVSSFTWDRSAKSIIDVVKRRQND